MLGWGGALACRSPPSICPFEHQPVPARAGLQSTLLRDWDEVRRGEITVITGLNAISALASEGLRPLRLRLRRSGTRGAGSSSRYESRDVTPVSCADEVESSNSCSRHQHSALDEGNWDSVYIPCEVPRCVRDVRLQVASPTA